MGSGVEVIKLLCPEDKTSPFSHWSFTIHHYLHPVLLHPHNLWQIQVATAPETSNSSTVHYCNCTPSVGLPVAKHFQKQEDDWPKTHASLSRYLVATLSVASVTTSYCLIMSSAFELSIWMSYAVTSTKLFSLKNWKVTVNGHKAAMWDISLWSSRSSSSWKLNI